MSGVYVIRTGLSTDSIDADGTVESYRRLARVGRAFRSLKTPQMQMRPLFVHASSRVRGHLFLCILAFYLEWHVGQALAPTLFEDEDAELASALRHSPVAPAQVSPSARRKAPTRRSPDGHEIHSFSTLLKHLQTLTLNRVVLQQQPSNPFLLLAEPTEIHRKTLEILGLRPDDRVTCI